MAKRENIENIAKQDSENRRLQGLKKKEYISTMIQTNFRIDPDVKEALQEHFKGKGLSFGSGIRMVLMEYIKLNGVEV